MRYRTPAVLGYRTKQHARVGGLPCDYVQRGRDLVRGSLKSQPASSAQEVLAGLVERVTFHNAENGFCVLRAKARGHRGR